MDLVFVLKWVKNILRCRFNKFNLSVSFPTPKQCDQIGRFFKSYCDNFLHKDSPNISIQFGLFSK